MTTEKRPEISVIVPVYKVENYLNECIASILAQTFADFELILVDDGSPDNCPAMCDAAAARDSRIRVIHKPNGGLSSARNAGMKIAQGNWIAFVDSDDKVLPQYLEQMYAAAARENAELVVCDYRVMNQDGSFQKHQEKLVQEETLTRDELIRKMILTPFSVAWTKLYRRDLINGKRFWEGKLYEDAIFSAELYPDVKRAVCVAQALYCYRNSAGSIMRSKRTVRNLVDQVDANYAMFRCALDHGLTDVLCVYYWLVVKYFWQNWKAITPEERKSAPAQNALACRRTAWQQLKQAGAVTPKNVFLAAVHRVSPPLYLKLKY